MRRPSHHANKYQLGNWRNRIRSHQVLLHANLGIEAQLARSLLPPPPPRPMPLSSQEQQSLLPLEAALAFSGRRAETRLGETNFLLTCKEGAQTMTKIKFTSMPPGIHEAGTSAYGGTPHHYVWRCRSLETKASLERLLPWLNLPA